MALSADDPRIASRLVEDESGCLFWIGALDENSVPVFNLKHTTLSVRKLVYVAKHGGIAVALAPCPIGGHRCVHPDHCKPYDRKRKWALLRTPRRIARLAELAHRQQMAKRWDHIVPPPPTPSVGVPAPKPSRLVVVSPPVGIIEDVYRDWFPVPSTNLARRLAERRARTSAVSTSGGDD